MTLYERYHCGHSLSVDVVHDFLRLSSGIDTVDVLEHPSDEMVLEGAFNDLVEEIDGQELVDVGAWEVVRERLTASRLY